MKSVAVVARCISVALFAVSLGACEPQEPTYQLDEIDGSMSGGVGGGPGVATGAGAGETVGGGGPLGIAGTNPTVGQGGAAGTGDSVTDGGGAPDALPKENSATAMFHGSPEGTATFTQHGVDVTVAIKLTSCSEGSHPIFIYGGIACDNPVDQGNRWDGERGNLADTAAASVIDCKADKTGTLNYTRSGASDATKWTVADHDFKYDVTTRVLVVSAVGNEASRQSCADFR